MIKSGGSEGIDLRAGAKRYMPGLDGLRTISVLAVIAYHLNFSWAQGGFLGVGIFFTLSGYLITDQLMAQWGKTGRINLRDFWVRRVRRLIPAVFFMLAVVGLWLALFDRSRLDGFKDDFASVALYFNNWWLIFHNVSYFESFGPQSPLGHLWSLAIEEQFYFLWPLLLILGLRFAPKRGKLALFTIIGAVASMLAMALTYQPGTDPSRVYYGTDTRAFALLIGAAFAIAFPSSGLPEKISSKKTLLLDFIGGAGLLGIFFMIRKTNEYDTSLYVGGLALFSVLSAVVVVVLAHPASRAAKIIGAKPLCWVGVRSYSLYLWHYPVITLTTPAINTGGFNISRAVFQVALSFLMAVISWNYIEKPFRRGISARLKDSLKPLRTPFRRRFALVLVMTPLFLFVNSCSDPMNKENRLSASKTGSPAQEQTGVSAPAAQTTSSPADQTTPQVVTETTPTIDANSTTPVCPAVASSKPLSGATGQQNAGLSSNDRSTGSQAKAGEGITAVGDSVLLDAAPYLNELLPGIIIDGKVGRQMYQAREVLNQLKGEGRLGSRVIIELGTNGSFNTVQLSQLLTSLKDKKQVVLVNVRVPRNWQDKVNTDLQAVAGKFSNVTVADWFSASKGRDSFFYNDGVHLKADGAKFYAELLCEVLLD